jgi:hypothetical protein
MDGPWLELLKGLVVVPPVLPQHLDPNSAPGPVEIALGQQHPCSMNSVFQGSRRNGLEVDAERGRCLDTAAAAAQFPHFNIVGGDVATIFVVLLVEDARVVGKSLALRFVIVDHPDFWTGDTARTISRLNPQMGSIIRLGHKQFNELEQPLGTSNHRFAADPAQTLQPLETQQSFIYRGGRNRRDATRSAST